MARVCAILAAFDVLYLSGSGFRVSGSGFRVPGAEFQVWGSGCRVPGFGFQASSSAFRVPGLGFRFRVPRFGMSERARDVGKGSGCRKGLGMSERARNLARPILRDRLVEVEQLFVRENN